MGNGSKSQRAIKGKDGWIFLLEKGTKGEATVLTGHSERILHSFVHHNEVNGLLIYVI